MSWVQTNWRSDDNILDGFPYSTNITTSIVTTISTTDIKFCWDFTQAYPVYIGRTIVDSVNNEDIKFWTTMNSFDLLGLPKPSSNKNNLTIPGAFRGCSNLRTVTIPRSVKYIDYYAFWGTGLTEVTIAQDCVYQSSSFPTGCVINRYS